ncbi:MAG: MFS transporter [Gemmatimonadota bacterium]
MPVLERLGLHRPELRAWVSYDWGISAFQVAITTALFPIYFPKVVAADLPPATATALLGLVNSAAMVVIALLSPILGTLADERGSKKPMLAVFLAIGVASTAGLWFVGRGDILLASLLYGGAVVGATGSFVFYEALLNHVARPEEIDRVSTAGYAIGYIGGGILLVLQLAAIQGVIPLGISDKGVLTRLAFVATAVWWGFFSIPLFRGVSEPAATPGPRTPITPRAVVARFVHTFRGLQSYPQALLMLTAFLVYNDGIQTIIKLAATVGSEIGIAESTLITAIVMVQFIGVPCAFAFGWLAGKVGAKRATLLGVATYAVIAVVGRNMQNGRDFLVLAGLVALVQGGTQALSRSLFARMIPASRSGEFFGLYSVFEKFAGIFGPLTFAASVALTGSSRNGVLALISFFIVGFVLLLRVDVAAGERAAQQPVSIPA